MVGNSDTKLDFVRVLNLIPWMMAYSFLWFSSLRYV